MIYMWKNGEVHVYQHWMSVPNKMIYSYVADGSDYGQWGNEEQPKHCTQWSTLTWEQLPTEFRAHLLLLGIP